MYFSHCRPTSNPVSVRNTGQHGGMKRNLPNLDWKARVTASWQLHFVRDKLDYPKYQLEQCIDLFSQLHWKVVKCCCFWSDADTQAGLDPFTALEFQLSDQHYTVI